VCSIPCFEVLRTILILRIGKKVMLQHSNESCLPTASVTRTLNQCWNDSPFKGQSHSFGQSPEALKVPILGLLSDCTRKNLHYFRCTQKKFFIQKTATCRGGRFFSSISSLHSPRTTDWPLKSWPNYRFQNSYHSTKKLLFSSAIGLLTPMYLAHSWVSASTKPSKSPEFY
jgi:hypothetical protein